MLLYAYCSQRQHLSSSLSCDLNLTIWDLSKELLQHPRDLLFCLPKFSSVSVTGTSEKPAPLEHYESFVVLYHFVALG